MKDILKRVCRVSDTLVRWGGDEFLLLDRQTDRPAATMLAERIRVAVSDHRFDLGDGNLALLSCSVGFTFFPFLRSMPELMSWQQVLDLADRALYRAKQAGRNQWVSILTDAQINPAVLLQRKDDDLDDLAHDGLIELQARTSVLPAEIGDSADTLDVETPPVERPRLID